MEEDDFQQAFDRRLAALLGLVDAESHPKLNPLAIELRELRNLALNIKFFGYDLARRLADALPPRTNLQPVHVGLHCKPSTQADLESDWVAYWCQELKTPVIFHRKLWELAYVLQALHDAEVLRSEARGLGFGCGAEPIASYLAARGVTVVATDLRPDAREAKGWVDTGQHASTPEITFHPHLVTKDVFEAKVRHRFVDMTAIPDDLHDFDFCWSICALEHLGSIENGMNFVIAAMKTLRPGGIAVHTTEFNFLDDQRTLDNWPTVLFQRAHFEAMAERLRASGNEVALLDFDVGTKPLDRFIDVPPYAHDWPEHLRHWGGESAHLKLSIDGFASTCFGLIIVKA
ncbi:MAG: class I SAM-dependent methyltransferase [Methylovirgula sp.]